MSESCSNGSPTCDLGRDGLDILRLAASGRDGLARALDLPRFRGGQIARWVFDRGARDFGAMTDLPLSLRNGLAAMLGPIGPPTVVTSRGDGTVKELVRLGDGETIECVLMEHEWGRTACLSTQVGCPIGCVFCASGQGGLSRDLTGVEIAGQLLALAGGGPPPGHAVLMGSGEPLLNVANVLEALGLLCDGHAYSIPERNVTLSTVGSLRGIARLSESGRRIRLAVSIHAADPALRRRLIPRKLDPLPEVVAAARAYAEAARRRPTFEYVMLRGVNDGRGHADRLATLLGAGAHVNLVPYNSVPDGAFSPADPSALARFEEVLTGRGLNVSVRRSAGRRLGAGCGQLRGRISPERVRPRGEGT